MLSALPNDLAYSRFGFTASRHVGNAVSRNRARRLMREAVRLNMQRSDMGWDMVFIARSAIIGSTLQEVTAACCALLRRAGMWRQE